MKIEIDNDTYDFGARLRKLREINKLTQNQLANRIGVSVETVNRYENNIKVPSLQRATKIAKVLHGSLDYLMGIDDNPKIEFHDLPEEKKAALILFIKAFIE